jgi:hypothetical protein
VQLATNFLNSPELQDGTGPRLTAFPLWGVVLQRDPTISARALRESQIAAGAELTGSMAEFLNSPQFQQQLQ